MPDLFDAVFQVAGWLLSAPILLLMIAVAFSIMFGQKPERAMKWAVNVLIRLVRGLFKLLFRSLGSVANARSSARGNNRFSSSPGGASDSADDLYRPPTGSRTRGRNNPRNP